MVAIPDEVLKVLNDDASVRVIATKSKEGDVHAIQVGSLKAPSPDTIIVGAILMKRTGKNLESMKERGELVSILAGNQKASYEIRVKVKDKVTSGPMYDQMNASLQKMGLKANAVWVFEVKEVWNQTAGYSAGTRMV
ncbi:MAG TPA: hypothetical protein PKO24_04910 [Methanomassiliicoccales archaeon]|jgi:hypothetical protein|nr:hypothetical protein [Euryarchaeota archaeon]HOE52954.1 hypothetical protein [Methanomassiliicoccales archaeon]HPD08955.1 hypothetical protein [Methanomassiliicoccales archaeon]HQM67359.1 hypothetical protein [Methanomassiliicoccales archaeon]HRU11632.1 hypothetical protein [Methanomassiliicoccales archaeon]